ncbi:MAG: DNRLRE domain-containing protein, partial [Acidobacteriota bacterium]|nr:DNRLRE domain-containing protein [Acidobacteriota bacterium]
MKPLVNQSTVSAPGIRVATRIALATALAALVALSAPVGAQGRSGRSAEAGHVKLDRHLQQRVTRALDDDAPEKVIVRLRPGARRGIIQRLRAQGATITADLPVVEAVATRLPGRMLRQLAEDRDVLSISTDAPVRTHGLSSAVTGEAQNGGYSLRRTLGLERSSASTTTASFRQGANYYTSALDGSADSFSPLSAYPTASSVWVEGYGMYPSGMLIRFENLVGTGPSQIPPGSTITAASLQLTQTTPSSTAASLKAHRMLVSWSPNDSWTSMATSGAGLQFDGVEASTTADASVPVLGSAGSRTLSGGGLAATVQSWVNGQPNNGWVLFQNSSSAVMVATSEDATLANRPMLIVTYRPPVRTTTLTGAGITIAVIDSGIEIAGNQGRIRTSRDFTTGLQDPPA